MDRYTFDCPQYFHYEFPCGGCDIRLIRHGECICGIVLQFHECLIDVGVQPLRVSGPSLIVRLLTHDWIKAQPCMDTEIFNYLMLRAHERNAGEAFRRDCEQRFSLIQLSRYETEARRAFYSALRNLRKLQAEPVPGCPQPIPTKKPVQTQFQPS